MNRLARPALMLALAGLVLAGCSSGNSQPGRLKLLLQTAKAVVAPKKPVMVPELTRAQLRKAKVLQLKAELPKRKARAYLLDAGQNGDVTTWATADGVTLSLRNGVLVQTRGLGQDLMSSQQPAAARIARAKGELRASYYYLTGDDQSYSVPLICQLESHGSEDQTIAGIRYRLRTVSEACAGPNVMFTNYFWFDGRGHIRKSRQWVGPDVGYLLLSDLRE